MAMLAIASDLSANLELHVKTMWLLQMRIQSQFRECLDIENEIEQYVCDTSFALRVFTITRSRYRPFSRLKAGG